MSNSQKTTFQRFQLIAKLLVATGLIYWMVQKGFLDLGSLFRETNWQHLIVGFTLCLTVILLSSWRWTLLVRGQGFSESFRDLLPLSFMGYFFNYAMPGSVGGDVIKGYYLLRGRKEGKFKAALTIFADRLIGLWAMAFMALVALLVKWSLLISNSQLQLLAFAISGVFLGFSLAFTISFFLSPEAFSKKFAWIFRLPGSGALQRVYETFHQYSRQPALLFKAFFLSLCSQTSLVFLFALVGHIIGEDRIGITAYFFAVPIGLMASSLPISPAGIGVGQAAMLYLFGLMIGAESQIGPNAMTVMQILFFILSLFGAYFYLRQKPLSEVMND